MRRLTRSMAFAAALLLCACDVQLRDTTPAQYQANHDLGMYEVSAIVAHDFLVTPGSIYVVAQGDKQRIVLTPNADRTEWHGLYSVRCRSSFPLQFVIDWKLPLDVRRKVVPAVPHQVRLLEPPLTRAVTLESAGTAPKGGWQGAVEYRFVTVPTVEITGAHIEPLSGSAEDVAAARPLSVISPLPIAGGCGDILQLRIASSAQHAHGTLVIDTTDPADPHWRTRVEFSPI
ncbi:MAG: hypothetical protein JOY68_03055 [Candidatus Dormibacteraeota bacterium]|nr:hypothetical protein [Candidatus Dormibacteraeota bacterium]